MAEGTSVASVQDLRGMDRDVARAAKALARWRSELRTDPEGCAERSPLENLRGVAMKSTWERLGSLRVGGADEPLRAALMRWVVALVQARLGEASEIAQAREEAEARGHFKGGGAQGGRRLVTWRDAWRGVALAGSPAEGCLWLNAAAEAAPPLATAIRAGVVRRLEVARRFGFAHPWEPLAASPLRASALRFLDGTDDLWRSVWKESASARPWASGAAMDLASILTASVARDAGDGWPGRLVAAWLEDLFRKETRGLRIELPELAPAVGAASFARALYAFGFAVRLAVIPSSVPFAVGHEPAFTSAHRLAFLFGALPSDPVFQARVLGLGRARALAQARVLARTALLEARLGAARLLLGDEAAFAPRDLFEELGVRLFGSPLDPRLCGAWPLSRRDEPARWVALLETPVLRRAMRERFDEDWFKNPRAWAFIRSEGSAPAHEPIAQDALDAGGVALIRAFEEALG